MNTLLMIDTVLLIGVGAVVFFTIVILVFLASMYHKAEQGQALVKTGVGGTKVSFNGMVIVPILHRLELMEISLKTVVISRMGDEGLICKDNMRADIKVTFFVRVNKTEEDVIQVAQSIGCARATDTEALESLFDAKFSEALKTVGKQFDFVELYNSREKFKQEILNIIGTDLNGYVLDDAAIDYLEQTSLDHLSDKNILDAEGIKKIIELTAAQKIKSNKIQREEEKVIKQQDVEAREAILELDKQLAEKEQSQKREVQSITAREEAETEVVREQERLKAENARIQADEQIEVAEQNKERQVIVAKKNKEKTEAVENERVTKNRDLEATEREKIVTLAQIEKEKSLEQERKNIQEVIRERVAIEKTVVAEQEKIKDTEEFATAERNKKVAITEAEMKAEEELVQKIKAAEAARQAAELEAKQKIIEAEAEQTTASKKAEAIKTLAEAKAAEAAAIGLSEAQVMEAKAIAREKEGEAEASIIEDKATAEAKGIRLTADAQAEANQKIGKANAEVTEVQSAADEQKGSAEARVMDMKYKAEAEGIRSKAQAMQILDGPGKDHEEFKLRLAKEKEVELAEVNIQKEIADAQAMVIAEALKSAKIDIVGGETMFFDQIVGSITQGKKIERLIGNSETLQDIKGHFFDSPQGHTFKESVRQLMDRFGVSTGELKDLSISALLLRLWNQAGDNDTKGFVSRLMGIAKDLGIEDHTSKELGA